MICHSCAPVTTRVPRQRRCQFKGAVSIRERPLELKGRVVPGHWEGDLLLGRHWTKLATLVERTTRLTVLVQLDGRDMHTVTAGLSREMAHLPEHVRRWQNVRVAVTMHFIPQPTRPPLRRPLPRQHTSCHELSALSPIRSMP